jgi:putative inorganic carbon (hco3(-)) transporter
MALAMVVGFALDHLEIRYSLVLILGTILLSLGLVMAPRLNSVALYLLAFNLPFTSIEKSFFLTSESTYVTSGVAVGLFELLLVFLYFTWFLRVMVQRRETLPRISPIDWWVLAFVAVHVLSLYNSTSRTLTVLEIVRLTKYAAAFFYIEHNLKRRQIKMMVAAVLAAIVIQGALGLVQVRTGNLLGIGRTKGASASDYEQYSVKNFESYYRAEGTTFDSHAYGLFLAMALPLGLTALLSLRLRPRYRFGLVLASSLGLIGLIISFARGSWVGFAAAALAIVACQLKWKRWRVVGASAVILSVLGAIAIIPFAAAVRQRIFEAPPELVTGRLETLQIALTLWRDSMWVGSGANTYMRLLETRYSVFAGDPYFIPPHNLLILVLTELGVIGLLCFLGFSIAVCRMTWQVISVRTDLVGVTAAAVLAAFTALEVQGLFDPIYVTNVTYFLLWFLLGMGAAMWRITFREDPQTATVREPAVHGSLNRPLIGLPQSAS